MKEGITMKRTTAKSISRGLKALGVRGHVSLKKYDRYTIHVSVNGKSFGLWDITKSTFVA